MQSTTARAPRATAATIASESLLAAFQQVPDPRRQASVHYPLAAILALAVSAIMANQHSVLAIAEWGRRQSHDLLARLGFPDGCTPCQSTLQRLFRQLDGHHLAVVLTEHLAASLPPLAPDAVQGVALDGKAQRGRHHYDGGVVHALTAYTQVAGLVVAQHPIAPGPDKAEAELTVAPQVLAQLDWSGRVLTGDALFCQRSLCQQVLDAGGDYLLLVRANQPTLHAAIHLLFDPPADQTPLRLLDERMVRTVECGHGRQQEVRHLVATTDLTAYLADELHWPGVAQVFRLHRTWRAHGQAKQQLLYGLTSLPPELGPPERLLALKRGHWAIENGLHRTKDVSFGEDASQIHCGHGPTVMALLRNTAITLFHRHGIHHIAATLREFSQYPERAVAWVLEPPCTHA